MATKYQRKMRENALREARLNPITTLGPEREAFRALAANNRRVDGSRVPSNQLMRGATYGDKQIDGKDLAAAIATGTLRVAQKSSDAAGPLRENVGVTTQRGGALDYLERATERKADIGNSAVSATERARQIDTYRSARPKGRK